MKKRIKMYVGGSKAAAKAAAKAAKAAKQKEQQEQQSASKRQKITQLQTKINKKSEQKGKKGKPYKSKKKAAEIAKLESEITLLLNKQATESKQTISNKTNAPTLKKSTSKETASVESQKNQSARHKGVLKIIEEKEKTLEAKKGKRAVVMATREKKRGEEMQKLNKKKNKLLMENQKPKPQGQPKKKSGIKKFFSKIYSLGKMSKNKTINKKIKNIDTKKYILKNKHKAENIIEQKRQEEFKKQAKKYTNQKAIISKLGNGVTKTESSVKPTEGGPGKSEVEVGPGKVEAGPGKATAGPGKTAEAGPSKSTEAGPDKPSIKPTAQSIGKKKIQLNSLKRMRTADKAMSGINTIRGVLNPTTLLRPIFKTGRRPTKTEIKALEKEIAENEATLKAESEPDTATKPAIDTAQPVKLTDTESKVEAETSPATAPKEPTPAPVKEPAVVAVTAPVKEPAVVAVTAPVKEPAPDTAPKETSPAIAPDTAPKEPVTAKPPITTAPAQSEKLTETAPEPKTNPKNIKTEEQAILNKTEANKLKLNKTAEQTQAKQTQKETNIKTQNQKELKQKIEKNMKVSTNLKVAEKGKNSLTRSKEESKTNLNIKTNALNTKEKNIKSIITNIRNGISTGAVKNGEILNNDWEKAKKRILSNKNIKSVYEERKAQAKAQAKRKPKNRFYYVPKIYNQKIAEWKAIKEAKTEFKKSIGTEQIKQIGTLDNEIKTKKSNIKKATTKEQQLIKKQKKQNKKISELTNKKQRQELKVALKTKQIVTPELLKKKEEQLTEINQSLKNIKTRQSQLNSVTNVTDKDRIKEQEKINLEINALNYKKRIIEKEKINLEKNIQNANKTIAVESINKKQQSKLNLLKKKSEKETTIQQQNKTKTEKKLATIENKKKSLEQKKEESLEKLKKKKTEQTHQSQKKANSSTTKLLASKKSLDNIEKSLNSKAITSNEKEKLKKEKLKLEKNILNATYKIDKHNITKTKKMSKSNRNIKKKEKEQTHQSQKKANSATTKLSESKIKLGIITKQLDSKAITPKRRAKLEKDKLKAEKNILNATYKRGKHNITITKKMSKSQRNIEKINKALSSKEIRGKTTEGITSTKGSQKLQKQRAKAEIAKSVEDLKTKVAEINKINTKSKSMKNKAILRNKAREEATQTQIQAKLNSKKSRGKIIEGETATKGSQKLIKQRAQSKIRNEQLNYRQKVIEINKKKDISSEEKKIKKQSALQDKKSKQINYKLESKNSRGKITKGVNSTSQSKKLYKDKELAKVKKLEADYKANVIAIDANPNKNSDTKAKEKLLARSVKQSKKSNLRLISRSNRGKGPSKTQNKIIKKGAKADSIITKAEQEATKAAEAKKAAEATEAKKAAEAAEATKAAKAAEEEAKTKAEEQKRINIETAEKNKTNAVQELKNKKKDLETHKARKISGKNLVKNGKNLLQVQKKFYNNLKSGYLKEIKIINDYTSLTPEQKTEKLNMLNEQYKKKRSNAEGEIENTKKSINESKSNLKLVDKSIQNSGKKYNTSKTKLANLQTQNKKTSNNKTNINGNTFSKLFSNNKEQNTQKITTEAVKAVETTKAAPTPVEAPAAKAKVKAQEAKEQTAHKANVNNVIRQISKAKEDLLTESKIKTLSNDNQKNFTTKLENLGTKLETIFKEQETKLGEELATALKKEASNKKKKVEELSEEEKENLLIPFFEKTKQLADEQMAAFEKVDALSDDD